MEELHIQQIQARMETKALHQYVTTYLSPLGKRNCHRAAASFKAAPRRAKDGSICWKTTSFLWFQIFQDSSNKNTWYCLAGIDSGLLTSHSSHTEALSTEKPIFVQIFAAKGHLNIKWSALSDACLHSSQLSSSTIDFFFRFARHWILSWIKSQAKNFGLLCKTLACSSSYMT